MNLSDPEEAFGRSCYEAFRASLAADMLAYADWFFETRATKALVQHDTRHVVLDDHSLAQSGYDAEFLRSIGVEP